ncbi:hypothetical protein D3C83_107020 [compost metagenome]
MRELVPDPLDEIEDAVKERFFDFLLVHDRPMIVGYRARGSPPVSRNIPAQGG